MKYIVVGFLNIEGGEYTVWPEVIDCDEAAKAAEIYLSSRSDYEYCEVYQILDVAEGRHTTEYVGAFNKTLQLLWHWRFLRVFPKER